MVGCLWDFFYANLKEINMKEFKHTKGPWNINPVTYFCGTFRISGATFDEEKSNKLLIAAAPDLLEDRIKDINEIGQWLSAALDDPKACDEFKYVIKCWFDRLSTIEKATGEKIEDLII